MNVHTPAAAQEGSWSRRAARARRELPWFHDKTLGEERSWRVHAAVLGVVTGGVAPAVVLLSVGWPSFAGPHVLGTALGGGLSGLLVGKLWFRLSQVLRTRGVARFSLYALFSGFVWGAFVGGVAGPALVALFGEGEHMFIKPLWGWATFSGGTSAVAAGITAAWFAPALAWLQAKGRAAWWLHLAWLPLALGVGAFALFFLGVIFRFAGGV